MLAGILTELGERTPGVFGGNIMPQVVDPAHLGDLVAVTAAHSRVVDFFFSEPDPTLVDIAHAHGALVSWQVGSREEAVAAAAAGCDFIIAQGYGAGGRVRGTIGLLALLDEVLDAVSIPVLAAGGIGSGRTLAAVLAAGADGARIGTRFAAATEAGAHPEYVQALIGARARDTVYTDAFRVGYDAPGRVLRSSLAAAAAADDDAVGVATDYYTGEPFTLQRFEGDAITARHSRNIAAMSHWAGESVGGVTRVQPAAEIIGELVEEAERLLRTWC
jgi:NAD(P)H-dependent flavin oxidoreductase YrpB (nitropropane dioxygenase family)